MSEPPQKGGAEPETGPAESRPSVVMGEVTPANSVPPENQRGEDVDFEKRETEEENDDAVGSQEADPPFPNLGEGRTAGDAVSVSDSITSHNQQEDENPLADESLPLLYYTRVQGSDMPRPPPGTDANGRTESLPLQNACTCSLMGRILLSYDNLVGPPTSSTADETPVLTLLQQFLPHLAAAGPDQPVELFVSILGFDNGKLLMLDAKTHTTLASSQLLIREGHTNHAVVALSMDATGNFLAAVDAGGMCTIFEFAKFQIQPVAAEAPVDTPAEAAASANVFSSFVSAFTGTRVPTASPAEAVASSSTTTADAAVSAASTAEVSTVPAATSSSPRQPALVVSSLQIHRISYPRNFGVPTTLALDPGYKRKREKAVLVGFADGRLVQTKRGFVFQRRTDAIVHQALPASQGEAPGIQSLVWRGSLVAWAEPSGIRLFDADALTKIAHVDRPVGARPSLYPTVRNLTARLCWETENRLLVAWGDCLLQLTVKESTTSTQTMVQPSEGGPPGMPVVVRRRSVECTMAWELDCIAAGVAPLDERHVILLGLVPSADEENEKSQPENEVEVQVLSRTDGNVVYSDLLPILKPPPETKTRRSRKKSTGESLAPYALLSTFDIPRMGNMAELQGTEAGQAEFDPVLLFAGASGPRQSFRDSHCQWDLSQVISGPAVPAENEEEDDDDISVDGGDSVGSTDSDDYSFVLRPLVMEAENAAPAIPPTLWIVAGSDAVAARVRNLDDAVAAAKDKPALALQRALRQRAQLRKQSLDDLVNAYFAAVLRLPTSEGKRLSLRRMKLAASAMPVLLGANIDLWKRWIRSLENLPGALFILRNVLPVRDPILPKEQYSTILIRMYEQILQMKGSSESTPQAVERLVGEAENHFLFTLLGWGTSTGLREHLQHYKYLNGLYPNYKSPLVATEDMARRRSQQTSAVYLSFPADSIERPTEPTGIEYQAPNGVDELHDSLFDMETLGTFLVASIDVNQVQPADKKGRVALDAMAKLCIMQGRYDAALKHFLVLGSRYGSLSLDEIETSATTSVEDDLQPAKSFQRYPYAFVLSLIETKSLHQMLLEKSLLEGESSVPPLIALIQLVGLELAGDFLTKNCVPVQADTKKSSRQKQDHRTDRTVGERRGTLPLDIVASQLETNPMILYWYLHCVFIWKPEVYVKFPNTAHPPEATSRLHRKALDLYIKYAGTKRDSVNVLYGVEAYRVAEMSTPLLSFLKVVLHIGGINPTEVVRLLQAERKNGTGISGVFAMELAYIKERYDEKSEENAKVVLELYLKGAKSLMLAVSYAQRTKEYTAELWQVLIDYCLSTKSQTTKKSESMDGNVFGSLLEAAALSGADLAQLVTKIPPGMAIEGLRPRLVAAVSDYRWKLQMHESANEVARKEIADLIREYEHRSRRGRRYESSDRIQIPAWAKHNIDPGALGSEAQERTEPTVLSPSLRPKMRPQRYHLSYSLPMR